MGDVAGMADFARFIIERERIRIRKENNYKRPWTQDPILAKYRFCNVRREDDAVTKWLRKSYYPAFIYNPDIWFAAVVARLFNNPETLDEIGVQRNLILPFKPEGIRRVLHARKISGQKNFNAAYIVSTNGIAMDKVDYIVQRVLQPLWRHKKEFHNPELKTLAEWYNLLTRFDGLGSFIAAQVVADLKYIAPWKSLPDWHTFAAPGPGSKRGLNRLRGYAPESPYPEEDWQADLEYVREKTNKLLLKSDLFPQPLHAQDIQNCLCEFDKYERARLGEGTPKQIYKEKK